MKLNELTPALAEALIEEQKGEWPLAGKNFAALDGVRVRTVDLDGWQIRVQFNPARIVSSGAKVDARAIAERPCFLCDANRPAEQRGIDLDGRYTLLVNPFPIFPRHFTIPATTHCLQLIDGRIPDMAALARALRGYVVFYNGPRCGASAPDHMHFQAGNADFLTLPGVVARTPLEPVAAISGASLSLCASLPMRFFVIDAADDAAAGELFGRLAAAMPVPAGEQEPMMNILAWADGHGGVRIVVIPRKRHRPSFYGTEGEGTMLLSPASVDMGGTFITPLGRDFDALDADTLRRVFDELCLSDSEIRNISGHVAR